jgi:hypothetical protein
MKHLIKALTVAYLVLNASPVQNAAIDYQITQADIRAQLYVKTFMRSVHVTMYHPVAGQTDDTPNIVADGSKFDIATASDLKWIAVSRDMHARWGGELSFGDIVYLHIPENEEKSGYYLVKDTMNRRWKHRIDILESPGEPMFQYANAELFLVHPKLVSREELWTSHLVP